MFFLCTIPPNPTTELVFNFKSHYAEYLFCQLGELTEFGD